MGTPVSSTNKTDCHNITEILLKVSLTHFKGTDTALDLTGIYYLPDLGKKLFTYKCSFKQNWEQIYLIVECLYFLAHLAKGHVIFYHG